MSEDQPPKVEYERAPCPRCGAVDMEDAGDKCRPSQDQTGEYWCSGEFGDGGDNDGYSIKPTAAYIAALDAWIDRTMHKPCEKCGVAVCDCECGAQWATVN
mgnify:CR=1 FL=1